MPENENQTPTPFDVRLASIIAFPILILICVFAYEVYFSRAESSEKIEIKVEQGLGPRKIGELLKREGVIRSKWAFVTYVSVIGKASSLKPGNYTFFDASISEIARDLAAGEAREKSITIPEGWSVSDIAVYLEEEKIVSAEEFKKAAAKHEGFLFPDTYRIYKDSSAEDIVEKMQENFDRKLDSALRQEITRQKKSISEIVILASLIEKEVVSEEDRAIVSGILWKRLGLGIALQVDATIVYLTGKRSTKVTHEDLRIKSPYNTYLNRGLPIGPISNPGLSAIKAAIYPKKSPYLYYLSAPDGRTIFSRTLEEHNEAKEKYLR